MQGGVLLLPLLPPCRPSLHGALVGIEAVIARCPCGDRGRPGMPSWSPARPRRIIMASCSCRGRARGRGGARKLAVTLSRCQCMRGATRAPVGQKKASVLLTAFVDCNWHTKTALARVVLKSTPSPASPAETTGCVCGSRTSRRRCLWAGLPLSPRSDGATIRGEGMTFCRRTQAHRRTTGGPPLKPTPQPRAG